MKVDIHVDTSGLDNALDNIVLSSGEMLQVAGAGALVINNAQRLLVPKDTRATETSIKSHIQKATAEMVEDDIGPETDYSPHLEYGTVFMSPLAFVRPSIHNYVKKIIGAISGAFGSMVKAKWPK